MDDLQRISQQKLQKNESVVLGIQGALTLDNKQWILSEFYGVLTAQQKFVFLNLSKFVTIHFQNMSKNQLSYEKGKKTNLKTSL